MHRPDTQARLLRKGLADWSGLKFSTEAHEAGTDAKDSALVLCGVTNGMVAGTAACSKKALLGTGHAKELTDEKAPLFALWRACRDHNPAC
jgi:hypothetical protein